MKLKLTLALIAVRCSLATSVAMGAEDISCPDAPALKSNSASQLYQLGKTFADEGLLQLSFRALERAALSSTGEAQKVVLAPALDCLEKISRVRPDLALPQPANLASLPASEIRTRYVFRLVLQKASVKPSASSSLLPLLKPAPLHALAAQGYLASITGDDKLAKTALSAALSQMKGAPEELRSVVPELQLALSRSLYALREYGAAATEYSKLFKIGRPMQDALVESGWTQVRMKNHAKAIGLSYELQTGKLARFFVPEASSILAISFLENCRYSEAKRAIEHFSTAYAPIVDWLAQNDGGNSLYEVAIARAEGTVGDDAVPERVWSIWAGSEVFHALQNGIRASFTEEREAREYLEDDVTDPNVRALLTSELKALAAYRAQAASAIEGHLARLNREMLSRIGKEAERLRFVRIETNQGAGRDLVYLNAHPEVLKLEKKLADAQKPRRQRSKLYWGKARINDPKAEIWIDEIGGFEGPSLNRCERPKLQAAK